MENRRRVDLVASHEAAIRAYDRRTQAQRTARQVFSVAPDYRAGWKVELDASGRVLAHTKTQEEAVRRARELAKESDSAGQVRIYGRNGELRIEYTYAEESA